MFMRKKLLSLLICLVLLLTTQISPAGAASKGDQTDKIFSQALTQVGQTLCISPSLVSSIRLPLGGGLAEYTYLLKVGSGRYDRIAIHRIVKEKYPFVPAKSKRAVMMVPGDTCNFHSAFFLPTDHDRSAAVYLAKNNIDVWGIDLRWSLVPIITSNFSFMKDWDTGTHLQDIGLGIKLARAVRSLTGSGDGKIFLLGHSRGAQFVYAYANQENMLPESESDLRGIIPMDMIYKFSPDEQALRDAAYARYQACKAVYDSGTYYSDEGMQMKALAVLAGVAPDEPSAAIPGMTNRQAALFALSCTYATTPSPLQSITPYYHFLAGTFDASGLPSGLSYADYNYVLKIALISSDYQSLGEQIDGEAIMSDAVEVPYDDYLGEIDIPVMYVGAAGGMGAYGEYTLSLLGSSDITSMIVQLESPDESALDYGHADLLWADNALQQVWQPITEWIKTH